jgi:hypothetical protein
VTVVAPFFTYQATEESFCYLLGLESPTGGMTPLAEHIAFNRRHAAC